MDDRKIILTPLTQTEKFRLRDELQNERKAYLQAEAELAEEQAQVNAFRMHCRLKLDDLVDTLQELNAKKQGYLTNLEFLRQGLDLSWLDEDDGILDDDVQINDETVELEEPEYILPTATPRDKEAEKRLYRELARRFHPDLAKTAVEQSYRTMMMAAVNEAYSSNNLTALYDLAGELDPEEKVLLAEIDDKEIRQLWQEIISVRSLTRKARQKLILLRKENTARLWRRAQLIEEQGKDYWSVIQQELQKVIRKRRKELHRLERQFTRLELENDMS